MDSSVQTQVKEDVLAVSVKELNTLHECAKSYHFRKLRIKSKEYEKRAFVKRATKRMVTLFQEGVYEVEQHITDLFEKEYLEEWFTCKVAYETCKKRDLQKVLRIASYIKENDYTVLEEQGTYKKQLSPFSYRGYKIGSIEGKFDFLLRKEDKITAVLIQSGAPKYSARARKAENLPTSSIELIGAYIGSYSKYQEEQYNVELWYLKNKDDQGMNLMDNFEHRVGKNIVRTDFSKLSEEELQKLLIKSISGKECGDCSLCIHRCVCQAPVAVRKEVKKEKDTKESKDVECKYTAEQEQVINFVNGQMCVVAVPGAGKTYSLVQRMLHLIKIGVSPAKILFVTFTKKAAKEIEERVTNVLTAMGITQMPVISTFNGLGYSILQENPMYVGRRIKLATDVDRYSLIAKAIASNPYIEGVSYDGLETEFGLIRTLDKLFDIIREDSEKAFTEQYKERKDVDGHLRVYHTYCELYQKAGFIDYNMQISLVNELFEKYHVLSKRYAEKYEYIMVDEFQDTAEEQAEMIYSIARHHGNLIVVGDDDQSVYKWRGGTSKYMLEFRKDFNQAIMVFMEDNFRSRKGILAASNALINNNGKRFEKHLKGNVGDGGLPVVIKGAERDYIKNIINRAFVQGYKPGEIAILARNNKRLAEVQSILEGFVPVSSPKDYMVEDSVFLAIYDMLSLYYDGLDQDVNLYRTFKYLHKENLLYKEDTRDSFYQNMLDSELLIPIQKGSPDCVVEYDRRLKESPYMEVGNCIVQCFERVYSDKIEAVLEKIIENLFGIKYHRVVDNLIDAANVRGIVKLRDLYDLMSDMILYDSKERVGYEVSLDAVNLLTCHDSKGKEFNNVIIFGAEDFSEEEEEIRVLYVAMTRAMNNLFLLETTVNQNNTLNRILPFVKVIGGNN